MTMYENEKAHQFPMGLNDDAYSTIRSQMLAMGPLTSLDRIFNITRQAENYKQVVINRDQHGESVMALAIKEQSKIVEKGARRICGRYGHEESVCYKVIGYPPGWGNRTRGRGQRGGWNNKGGRGASRGRGRETAAVVQENGLLPLSSCLAVLGQPGISGPTIGGSD